MIPNGKISIDVILADNSRIPAANPWLIHYSVGGVIGVILKAGLDVSYVNLMADFKEDTSVIGRHNVADVYCYGVFFGNKVNAFKHMVESRHAVKAPRLIIAFGPFASVFAEEILLRRLADVVVTSDPEFVIPMVVQKFKNNSFLGNIPNLSYMDDGKVVYTQKQSFHDLDEIPFVGPYLLSLGYRPAFLLTARGCQYHCLFCDRNVLWGGGVRHRSVEHVLKEIKELVEIHHVKEIRFLDEDLAADRKRLTAICKGMREIKGDFFWECSACVDSVNENILLLMAHSRCKAVYFGVESASPQLLRSIGKKYGPQEILNSVRWAKMAGLRVEVMLTTGNPDETDEDRILTQSVLQEMGPEIIIITNRLVILPGTALYRRGLREGWFTQESFFEDEGLFFYNEGKLI